MRADTETVSHEAYLAGNEDSHGNPADGWADPVDVGIYAFNPGGTSEPLTPGHDRAISTPTIYTAPEVSFNPRDRVTVRGIEYEVDGVTLEFRNPMNSIDDGNATELRRVDG